MNPFASWTKSDVAAHNAKVGGHAKEVSTMTGTDGLKHQPLPSPEPLKSSVGANQKTFTINTEPVPAPRMSRRDKWLKPRRPCVQRYFDYREVLQRAVGDLPVVPDEIHCNFLIAMPESWSKKKRQQMAGKPHKTRPDRDNLDKAVCDALFLEDGGVWKGSQEKRWAAHGRVEITMIWAK